MRAAGANSAEHEVCPLMKLVKDNYIAKKQIVEDDLPVKHKSKNPSP